MSRAGSETGLLIKQKSQQQHCKKINIELIIICYRSPFFLSRTELCCYSLVPVCSAGAYRVNDDLWMALCLRKFTCPIPPPSFIWSEHPTDISFSHNIYVGPPCIAFT